MNEYNSLADVYVHLQPDGFWYFDDPVQMSNIAHAQQWAILLNKILSKRNQTITFSVSSAGKSVAKTDNILKEFYNLCLRGFPPPPIGNLYVGVLSSAFIAGKRTGVFSAPITENPGAGIFGTNLLEGELIVSFFDTFREINGSKESKEESQKLKKGIASANAAYIKSLSNFFLLGGNTYVGQLDFYSYDKNISENVLNQWWNSLIENLNESRTTNYGPVVWNVVFSPAKGLRIRGYFSIKTSGEFSDLNNRLAEIDAMWKSASMGQGYSSATVPYFQENRRYPHFLAAEDLLPGSAFRSAISALHEASKYFRPENFSGAIWGYKPYRKPTFISPHIPQLLNGLGGATGDVIRI